MIALNEELADLDLPERRDRVARLFRYAQVGRCVNSVTHDLNNALGAIMAYAELIGMDSDLPPETNRMLGEIINSVKRCSDMVNGLTSIARKERPDIQLVVVSELVQRTLDLRRHDMQVAHIQLEPHLNASGESLVVDKARLEQAMLYLISNAIEALEDGNRKKLRVTVSREGEAFLVSVWDSGPPIPEEVRAQMFEPYFTTKEVDHLGLGLHVAAETARSHAGDLSYHPETGFTLRLPLVNDLLHS